MYITRKIKLIINFVIIMRRKIILTLLVFPEFGGLGRYLAH